MDIKVFHLIFSEYIDVYCKHQNITIQLRVFAPSLVKLNCSNHHTVHDSLFVKISWIFLQNRFIIEMNSSLRLFRPIQKHFLKSSSNSYSKVVTSRMLNVSHFSSRRVTIEQAREMARTYDEMPNDILLAMAASGDQGAKEERLLREIMVVENLSWDDAKEILLRIKAVNREYMGLFTTPYKIGLAASLSFAVASFPLTFDYDTVVWFNKTFVTAGSNTL